MVSGSSEERPWLLVQLIRPGYRAANLADDVARDVESLCGVMADCLLEANVMLNLFEQARASYRAWEQAEAEKEARLEGLIWDRVAELAGLRPEASAPELLHEARRQLLGADRAPGEIPWVHRFRLSHLHARSYIVSLAQMERTLEILAGPEVGLGESADPIAGILANLSAEIPHLRDVRNSIQHAEDRARGLNRRRRPLVAVPVANDAMQLPGGALIMNLIRNDILFGMTIDDGSYREVEVSFRTLSSAQRAAQEVLDALQWTPDERPYTSP